MDENQAAVNAVIVAGATENQGEIVTAENLNIQNIVTEAYSADNQPIIISAVSSGEEQPLVISTVSHDVHDVANVEAEETVIVTTSDHDYVPEGGMQPHIVILSEALEALENQAERSQEVTPVTVETNKHQEHEGKTVEEITNEIISIIAETGGMVTMVPCSMDEHSYSQNTSVTDNSQRPEEVVIQATELENSYEGTVQTVSFAVNDNNLDNTVKKLKKSVKASKILSPEEEKLEKIQKSLKEKPKPEQKVFKVYRCGQCSQSFYDTESYLQHLPMHADQESFDCLICQKKLSSIFKLKRHMMLHDSKFKCNICGKMFLKEKNLMLHKNLHEKKMFGCSKCKKKFFRPGDLKNHMAIHACGKTFKCEECEEIFSRHDSYLWHKKGHNPEEVMKCETCNDIITSLNSLRHHLKLHKTEQKENDTDFTIQEAENESDIPFICQFCDETFQKYKEFTKHVDGHGEKDAYSCDKCDKKFSTYAGLYKHKLRCENTDKYACTVCDKVFKYERTLEVHMNFHNGILFKCEEPGCKKEFKTKQGLFIHMKIHAGTAHECNICGKLSTSRTNHEEHMMIHTGEKPHVCTQCGKGFIQKRKLKEHMYTHLGKNRPHVKMFKCDICDHEYSSKKALIEHKRDHTGDMPYVCNICGMKFSRQTGYRNHMNRHEDKRNFKCKECGRGFNYNSNLKAHMVVHSGVKPFKCDICPKAYTRAAELRHHQATVHEGKNLNKFFCKYCNKGFSHVTNLRHHVYTHTGEKPYKCHLCDAAFTTNQSLKFHKKKVHSITEPDTAHKIGKYKDHENLEKGLQCNFSSDEENEVEVYTQAVDEEIESATVKVQQINDENVIYLNLSDLDDAESFIAIIETPMEIQTTQ